MIRRVITKKGKKPRAVTIRTDKANLQLRETEKTYLFYIDPDVFSSWGQLYKLHRFIVQSRDERGRQVHTEQWWWVSLNNSIGHFGNGEPTMQKAIEKAAEIGRVYQVYLHDYVFGLSKDIQDAFARADQNTLGDYENDLLWEDCEGQD